MEFADRVADKRERLLHYVMQQFRLPAGVAEDIVQETIAVSLQRQEQFLGGECEAALFKWLKTTAFRKGLKMIDPIQQPAPLGTNDRSDAAGTPSRDLRLNETRTRIYDAVAGLSEEQRTVITWFFFQSRSVRQIAEQLGKHEGSISRIKARAIETLAQQLSPEDFQTWLS